MSLLYLCTNLCVLLFLTCFCLYAPYVVSSRLLVFGRTLVPNFSVIFDNFPSAILLSSVLEFSTLTSELRKRVLPSRLVLWFWFSLFYNNFSFLQKKVMPRSRKRNGNASTLRQLPRSLPNVGNKRRSKRNSRNNKRNGRKQCPVPQPPRFVDCFRSRFLDRS